MRMHTSLVVALALWASPATGQMRFFPSACPDIVFFAPCPARLASSPDAAEPAPATPAPPTAHAQEPGRQESVFAEPQVGPDGKLRVYLPPKPVRDFLEHPTPENALAYRQWNVERLEKLMAAQAVLDQVSGVPSGLSAPLGASSRSEMVHASTPPSAALTLQPASRTAHASPALSPSTREPTTQVAFPPPGRPRGPAGTTEVLYLLATWCPYSARQTPIVAEFARAHREIRVSAIAFDSKPETIPPYAAGLPFPIRQGSDEEKVTWAVRAYPTIVILERGVPIRRITGLTPFESLKHAVGVNGGSGR